MRPWTTDPFWVWLSTQDDDLSDWTFSEIVLVALAMEGGE